MKIDKRKFDLALANAAYTLKELANKSGIAEVTICRITKGKQKARLSTIGKLAKALNVRVEEIIVDNE